MCESLGRDGPREGEWCELCETTESTVRDPLTKKMGETVP